MKRRLSFRSRQRGASLVEVVFASTLTVVVLAIGVSTFLTGTLSWARGEGRIDAQESSQVAIRLVSQELREAMAVTVDADGRGLSYRLPTRDANGNYTMPITWDGVARRIEVNGTSLRITGGAQTRVVARGLIFTDPQSLGGTQNYRIFTAGNGTITRSLTVMVVTRREADGARLVTSRSRETIYLRNIPDLYR